MTLSRLVLLRHGRTAWNAEHRMQGRLDPELDETGVAQAHDAASPVAAYLPTLVVASDLVRARRTAEIVAKAAGLVPRVDERLRESSVGEWEGLTGPEVDAGWPGGLELWRTNATWAPPGGESRVDVARRASPVLADLADELDDDDRRTALVVAHGGTIISLTGDALGLPHEAWPALAPLGNCHWAVLDFRVDRWRLVGWGLSAMVHR